MGQVVVDYKKANILGFKVGHDYVKLTPKINTIDEKIWEEAKKQSRIKQLMDAGFIVEVRKSKPASDPKPSKKDSKQTSSEVDSGILQEMKVGEAVELIQETHNIDVLESWLAEEKEGRNSKRVVTILEEQIEDLLSQPEEDQE